MAKCSANEVIMVESAVYGRMKLGKCVDVDFGFLGCSVDLLQFIDNLCSGRRTCQFAIADLLTLPKKPCQKSLSVYLEAAYSCMKSK